MRHRNVLLALLAVLVLSLPAGCDFDQAPTPTTPPVPPTHVPGELVVESAQELGLLENPAPIRARDGGLTAFVSNKILWVFGDTTFTQPNEAGLDAISNSAGFSTLRTPFTITSTEGSGIDATGAPLPLLPYNQEELAYNEAHGNKSDDRYALWPTGFIRQRDSSGLVFYSKVLIEPGEGNTTVLGSGVAHVDYDATVATRDPDLLFEPPDPLFGQGIVVGDLYFYAYACDSDSAGGGRCKLARVPVETPGERAAYSFWDGSGWVEDIQKAAIVLTGPTSGLTVSWNPYLGSYLATYAGTAATGVFLRAAPAPEGPWSEPVLAFTPQSPSAPDRQYTANEHSELARQGGQTLHITYYRPTSPPEGAIRVVEVKLR